MDRDNRGLRYTSLMWVYSEIYFNYALIMPTYIGLVMEVFSFFESCLKGRERILKIIQ